MKKVIGAALFVAALFVAGQANAQSKDTTSFKTKVHKSTKRGGNAATKIGNKTS